MCLILFLIIIEVINMPQHTYSVAQNWQLNRIKMTHVSIHGIKIEFSEPRNCNITTISKR
ncbi:hypothetical protein VCRA2123E76_30191 [Vibrio crassostreae]|nr:hypothetical protein VCRA2123E76_30191 [Vibrio crassostreae]